MKKLRKLYGITQEEMQNELVIFLRTVRPDQVLRITKNMKGGKFFYERAIKFKRARSRPGTYNVLKDVLFEEDAQTVRNLLLALWKTQIAQARAITFLILHIRLAERNDLVKFVYDLSVDDVSDMCLGRMYEFLDLLKISNFPPNIIYGMKKNLKKLNKQKNKKEKKC